MPSPFANIGLYPGGGSWPSNVPLNIPIPKPTTPGSGPGSLADPWGTGGIPQNSQGQQGSQQGQGSQGPPQSQPATPPGSPPPPPPGPGLPGAGGSPGFNPSAVAGDTGRPGWQPGAGFGGGAPAWPLPTPDGVPRGGPGGNGPQFLGRGGPVEPFMRSPWAYAQYHAELKPPTMPAAGSFASPRDYYNALQAWQGELQAYKAAAEPYFNDWQGIMQQRYPWMSRQSRYPVGRQLVSY